MKLTEAQAEQVIRWVIGYGVNGWDERNTTRIAKEMTGLELVGDVDTMKATIVDGVVTCECGSTEFRYDEDHPSTRTMAANKGGVLVFNSDFEWFDGDDDPGVVCDGCGRPVNVGGAEIDWR